MNMICSEIQDQLSAYYDGELSTELRSEVVNHVEKCDECTAELGQFKNLGSMIADLEQPETPASVWAAVKQGLESNREGGAPVELAQRELRPPGTRISGNNFRLILQSAAALAATALVGFVGWVLWHDNNEHEVMAKAMEQVASEIDSDGITTLLLDKFGGSQVTYQDAITQVGFRPIASNGLPEGYSVDSIQVLDMPCCKCTQTACRRPDKTRFFIYEHENENPGWFEHRKKRRCNCGGTDCKVVEIDDQLAATFKKGKRHVTLLGVRDEKEIELLVSQFEEKS